MPRSLPGALIAVAVLTGVLAGVLGGVPAGAAQTGPACDPERIEILVGQERHPFSIEIADDPAEQARGLMFRPVLPEGAGMLFVFDPPRPASFWMRNTMIPLDMLFIDDAGRVESVAERNDTFSDRVSTSEGVVRAVLEIKGGLSRRLGIGPGAQVRHAAFRAAPEPLRCAE